jgi:hypothetical protein
MSDISELFDRDPLSLSEQDIGTIITTLRSQRAAFKLGEKSAGKMAKPKAEKKPVSKVAAIDLSSLGLLPPGT